MIARSSSSARSSNVTYLDGLEGLFLRCEEDLAMHEENLRVSHLQRRMLLWTLTISHNRDGWRFLPSRDRSRLTSRDLARLGNPAVCRYVCLCFDWNRLTERGLMVGIGFLLLTIALLTHTSGCGIRLQASDSAL